MLSSKANLLKGEFGEFKTGIKECENLENLFLECKKIYNKVIEEKDKNNDITQFRYNIIFLL